MRKSNTRLLVILLNLMLAITLFCSCGKNTTEDSSQEAVKQKDSLQVALYDHLAFVEECFSLENSAYEYTEKFITTQDWKTLSEARCACFAAAEELKDLETPSINVNNDEFADLATSGVDITYIKGELAEMEEQKDTSDLLIRQHLLSYLELSFYDKTKIESAKTWIESKEEANNLLSQYYMAMTNYMLLDMYDSAQAKACYDELSNKCPLLSASATWYDSMEEAEAAGTEVADKYEELLDKVAANNTVLSEDLYDESKMMENEDTESLIKNIADISGAPEYFMMPGWAEIEDATFAYLYKNSTGDFETVSTLDDVNLFSACDNPAVYLTIEGIDETRFSEYITSLKNFGYELTKSEENTENDYTIYMDDYAVNIQLKDGTVYVIFKDEDSSFAPYFVCSETSKDDQ